MKKLLFIFLCLLTCGVLQANHISGGYVIHKSFGSNNICYYFDRPNNCINNPLAIAIFKKDLKQIETLIKDGADVNELVNNKTTALCIATHYVRNDDIVKLLIDNGANINAKCIKGNSPLHYLVWSKSNFLFWSKNNLNTKSSLDIIKYIVEKGANVNAQNDKGNTPLFFAKTKNIAEYLIDKGADVNSVDKNNTSLIVKLRDRKKAKYLVSKGAKINNAREAIAAGKTKLAKEFINKENYSDEELAMLLYDAAYYNEVEVAKLLISKGVDVNVVNKDEGAFADSINYFSLQNLNETDKVTPLHHAAIRGNFKMVKFLVNNGADVNAKFLGANPLYFAAQRNHTKVMEYLIKKGADVNTKFNHHPEFDSIPILEGPCLLCNKKAIEILLKNKAEVNVFLNGIPMIALAALPQDNCPLKKREQILKMMIKYGADINMKYEGEHPRPNALEEVIDQDEYHSYSIGLVKILVKLGAKSDYAIRYYAAKGNKEMIEFLLKHGFDINLKDKYGFTAFDHLINDKTNDMKQFLVLHGAKSSRALCDYAWKGDKEMVLFLLEHGFDINMQDDYGYTALDCARSDEMKQFLISHGAKSGKELKEKSKQESKEKSDSKNNAN
ncbi:MAG: ankyrin repeat domain-containing protein [Elusimicrobiaceae bacterium]|nr:ankyrin repeat domain-containing protein [Elusimicrobiaceae bacterium]